MFSTRCDCCKEYMKRNDIVFGGFFQKPMHMRCISRELGIDDIQHRLDKIEHDIVNTRWRH